MKIIHPVSSIAIAIAICGAATPVVALAQDAATAAAPQKIVADPAEEAPGAAIVVLGTRRTDRSVTDSASPVDVISAAEISSQPSGNMLDIIKNIVPSFYVPQNTITDASTFVRAPSLRGLPGSEVLVMINGKRYNRSALVQVAGGSDTALSAASQGSDISLIPAIAVANLQILRDGATAQYGSDAIAGVLNYGLKEKTGLEMQARYGQYYENGDGKSVQVAGDVGVGIGDIGFINLAGEYNNDNRTSRGATRASALYLASIRPDLQSQIPNYPGPAQYWGTSPTENYKFFLNSAIDVTANSKLYFFANYAHSKTTESFNYRPIADWTWTTVSGTNSGGSANDYFKKIFYLTPCPSGNTTCPTGGYVKDDNTFKYTSLYPAGFTPQFVGVTEQMYGTLGYKGDIGDLHYDISGSLARNTLALSMYQSLNGSYGPDTQTSFDFGKLKQEEQNANLDLSYPIEIGIASPLTLSGGAEYRKEKYTLSAGDVQSYAAGPYASTQAVYTLVSPGVYAPYVPADPKEIGALSPGASGYGGTSPDAAGSWSQTSYAGYVDLEGDLTETLSLGLAGRYEHYNTFGGTLVGKVSGLWKVTPTLSLRGTVGNGFHAPSPGQSHTSILTTAFNNGVQTQTGTYPVDSPISQYYGAKTLTPEKSTNYGLGFVFNPVRAVSLTVDAYRIEVRNRIGVSQTYDVTAADIALEPALAAVGDGGSVQYFTNAFNTRTQGVDVVGTYRTELSEAQLNFTLAYNYNLSKVTKRDPDVISDAQVTDIEHAAPNHRAVFNTSWVRGPVAFNIRTNYYGSWTAEVSYGGGQVFGSRVTFDLDASYTFAERFTFTLGALNFTDERPERLNAASGAIYTNVDGKIATNAGEIYPSSGGPFGLNGGFWYGRIRVKY